MMFFRNGYQLTMYPAGAHISYFQLAEQDGIEKTLWNEMLKDTYKDMPLKTAEQIEIVKNRNSKSDFLKP